MYRLAAACVLFSLVAAGALAAETTPHRVANRSFDMKGYVCEGTKTRVFYPESAGRFPVIVYGHGAGGAQYELDEGIRTRLETVASMGFVIVAPNTGGSSPTCNGTGAVWRDLNLVLQTGDQPVRELIGSKADWERLGLWGYSMGGKAVPLAAHHSTMPVRALVASHGARNSSLIRTPSLYITAKGDTKSSKPEKMRKEFNSNRAENKVFVETDGVHEEPIYKGSMVPWVGRFFMCHLSGDQKACNAVYGNATTSLCSSGIPTNRGCIAVYKDHLDPAQEPTVFPEDLTTQAPTIAPEDPTTQEPTIAPEDSTTHEPTVAPVDPAEEPTIVPEDATPVFV